MTPLPILLKPIGTNWKLNGRTFRYFLYNIISVHQYNQINNLPDPACYCAVYFEMLRLSPPPPPPSRLLLIV